MKKLFFFLYLFLSFTSVYAQNFVPDPTLMYNIEQTNSQLVVGPTLSGGFSTTQPTVITLANLSSQAFSFIPVSGKANTYYLLNGEGKYLNKVSTVSWDTWNVIFESTTFDTSSEWSISGTDPAAIRLICNANSKYLASDKIVSGSALYCNKEIDNVNGLFGLKVATIDNSPKFSILEKNVTIEIEKDLQPYPLWIAAVNQNYDINATASAGFSVGKSTFTPADFTSGAGKLQFDVQVSTANVGDTGKVIFSYTRAGVIHKLDSVFVTPVATYERFFIMNKAAGLVISNNTTIPTVPSLATLNIEDGLQYFFFRPVHHGVTDSLYYMIQDGNYRMIRKAETSDYDVEFGFSGNESIWKITPQANGARSITNFVTGKSLGTDGLAIDSKLYDDKTFAANPTAGPYCEWTILSAATALDPAISLLSGVSLSNGVLKQNFSSDITTYDVWVPADSSTVKITGSTVSTVSTIVTNPVELVAGGGPAVLTVLSGDGLSTTDYNFNFVQMTFDKWAAGGETGASKSTPNQWGWKCPNAVWASANSTTAGTVRYIDNPVNYKHNGVAGWTGRVLYTRWDGNVTTSANYSYPVYLEAGKSYTFSGKYAWNSVVPADSASATFTFEINTAWDNSGTKVLSVDSVVSPRDLLNLHDVTMTFTPNLTGIHYLTIKNSSPLLAAIADLSIGETTTGLQSPLSNSLFATVTKQMVNIHGTVAGDAVRVYNESGQLVNQLRANSDITSIHLNSGMYIIKVNAFALKVIK